MLLNKPIVYCACGCGEKVKNDNAKYTQGHHMRSKKMVENQRERWLINNPIFKEENKRYGEDNPTKRPEVRKKISENNPMHNPIHRKKATKNRAKVGFEKLIESNKTLWEDKELLERRIKTYCENLANGKIKLRNNWKCGIFIRDDGLEE